MWSIPFGRRSVGFRRRASSNKQHSSRRSARKSLTLEKLEDRYLLAGDVLYQVNAGGGSLLSGQWEADTSGSPAIYSNASETNTFSNGASIDLGDASIPAGTPEALFQSERWDPSGGQEMQWNFAVAPGEVEVRLYFAEIYGGAFSVGARTFDVSIEGQQVLDNYDVFADVGANAGVVKSFIVTSDANLDIDFGHVNENPAIKGIEVLQQEQGVYEYIPFGVKIRRLCDSTQRHDLRQNNI